MNLPVRRTRENAVIAGVCAGLARRWGIDANLLRIALIVLSLASGLGLVLYGVGVLVLPADESSPSPVHRILPFTRNWSMPAVVIGLAVTGFLVFGMLGGWSGIGLLPVLVALGIWYLASKKRTAALTTADPTPFERAADAWRNRLVEHQVNSGAIPATAIAQLPASPLPGGAQVAPAADLVRQRPKRANRLWWLALGLMAIGCTAVALAAPDGPGYHIAGLDYLAVILASLGITLVVATWRGRPRLMGLATVLVMIATLITWVAQSPTRMGELRFGDESHTFTTAADLPPEIATTAGNVDLDFTSLTLTEDTTVSVELGAGEVSLQLPTDINSVVSWEVGVGDVQVPGEEEQEGMTLTGDFTSSPAPAGTPVLTVQVSLRAGSLTVVTP